MGRKEGEGRKHGLEHTVCACTNFEYLLHLTTIHVISPLQQQTLAEASVPSVSRLCPSLFVVQRNIVSNLPACRHEVRVQCILFVMEMLGGLAEDAIHMI